MKTFCKNNKTLQNTQIPIWISTDADCLIRPKRCAAGFSKVKSPAPPPEGLR